MIENYHTHTYRCLHARGTEEAYIRKGIERRLQVLGFSDHAPYFYDNGFESRDRMTCGQITDYYRTVGNLREKYRDRIRIPIGFEMEYYPKYFRKVLSFMKESEVTLESGGKAGCQYLLLGQHYLHNEYDDPTETVEPTQDERRLALYVDMVIEAMETGVFTYVAHPDVFHFTGPESLYEKHYRRLCEAAREHGIPLEINLLGLLEGRHYPSPLFFDIAHDVGNEIVFGCDAHDDFNVANPEILRQGEAFARAHALTVSAHVTLTDPFSM